MKNKKNVIITVMCAVALLMATGYAYFATQLNINATGNITSQWNVYFESISNGTIVGNATNVVTPSVSGTSANMNVNLNIPGDSITYNIVLKNGGTVPAIIEDIDAVATGSGAIIYSISGLNIGDKLAAGASKTITIKIEYDSSITSQPSETTKTLTVNIDVTQDIGQSIANQTPIINQSMYLSNRILKENNLVTSGAGLYSASDDLGTSYYFSGNVQNNYVSFASYEAGTSITGVDFNIWEEVTTNFTEETPMYWRIIRINGDGTVRLIYDGTTPIKNGEIGVNNIGYSAYAVAKNDSKYVGYTYSDDNGGQASSLIKTYTEDWYNMHLYTKYNSYIADSIFCNDRTATYGYYDKDLNYSTTPIDNPYTIDYYFGTATEFNCPNPEDRYTVNAANGNGYLTHPVGLPTVKELEMGSTYIGSGTPLFWTMSPALYSPDLGIITSVYVYNSGNIDQDRGDVYQPLDWYTIRPVINLRSDVVAVLEGTGVPGSASNPYVVKTN